MSLIHDHQFDIHLEHQHIEEHRQRYGLGDSKQYSALAISGGGVRSASFALGVMQGLVSADIMKNVDYLSTASGGGYIGSTLTWLLNQINASQPQQPASVEAGHFPLGRIKAGNGNNNAPDGNAELDFIRHHSSYLTPTKALNYISLLAVILRSSFVSITTYFLAISALLFIFVSLGAFEPVVTCVTDWLPEVLTYNWFLLLAALMVFVFASGSFIYAVFTRILASESLYQPRTRLQTFFGNLIYGGVIALILASIPLLHALLTHLGSLYTEKGFAGLSTFLGFVMGVIQFFRLRKGCVNDKRSQLLIFGAATLLIYGLFFSAYLLDLAIINHERPILLMIVLFIAAGVSGLYINTNYISLHRMYRDRLMECYLPNLENIRKNIWGYASVADQTGLDQMCQGPNQRPYHIINTNLVLSTSKKVQYQSRGGDSFILSPLLCGSTATGWVRTASWLKDTPSSSGMTLATAMAASGASVNPNAGNNSRGMARTPFISAVLSLLNVRLGIWATNPRFYERKLSKPAFLTTLIKSFNENEAQIELSDGGHFDNLAIYELIRRRVNIIVASDAGADKHFVFDDLGNCIEKVRVDFNVNIRFNDPLFTLDNLQPGSAGASQREILKYGLAKNGFAIATIEYPPLDDENQTPVYGTLIYIKATMVSELPVDVLNFKASHPDFPHEPTSDQFFNEIQFEAYRELGYQITKNMVKECNSHAWRKHFI
ncbi:patatin-like phospholipase family protein [Methylophilus flavus]|uniref:Patatin-like phospholipase family protein n=1 Tax=Methylophilus flavus TaxID=640084 RepID=A0ABW3PH92_9PROT